MTVSGQTTEQTRKDKAVNDQSALRGIVHGKTTELDQDAGLPEGQPVTVVVHYEARVIPAPQ